MRAWTTGAFFGYEPIAYLRRLIAPYAAVPGAQEMQPPKHASMNGYIRTWACDRTICLYRWQLGILFALTII